MDLKLLFVVVLLLVVGWFSTEPVSVGELSENLSISSFESVSIRDLDLNGSGYVGESVSVTGEPGPASYGGVSAYVEDRSGYKVFLKCEDYVDLGHHRDYSFNGVVKQKTVKDTNENYELFEKNISYIDCTEPPVVS